MHIFHDFISTKTCPSYEFLVVRTGAGLRPKKCRVWWVRVQAKFLKLLQVWGCLNFAGAGHKISTCEGSFATFNLLLFGF